MGISIRAIKKGLLSFKGVQRRFNKIFTYNHVDYYDDYAHHPTEIKFVLDGLKEKFMRIMKRLYFSTTYVISRLKDLRKEFSYSFSDADTVIFCPIFTAGEKNEVGV